MDKRKSSLVELLRTIILIPCLLYAISMSVILPIAYAAIDETIVEFGLTLAWLALFPLPVVLVASLLLRSRGLWLALLVPTILWAAYYGVALLPKERAIPADQTTFSVMTYNLLTSDSGKEVIADTLRETDADVVALQEVSLSVAMYLEQELADVYPHRALHGQEGRWDYFRGQGILSKYPIIEDDYWIFADILDQHGQRAHGQQRAEIAIGDAVVVLYNIHPWPPYGWGGGLGFDFDPADGYAHAEIIRRILERVETEIDAQPLLVVGDLNMSPQHVEYRQMQSLLVDSMRAVGRGLGHTYPACGFKGLPELIRLDYVFHNALLDSYRAHVVDVCEPSDHKPVLVTLGIKP